MKFNERVLNYEFKLNDTDDLIVAYIEEHKTIFSTISMTVMAQELFIVPNTITRFCRKLGYDGFSELKAELKSEVNFLKGEAEKLTPQRENLIRTFALIDEEREAKIIKHLIAARKIIFFAVGQTAYPCKIYAKNLQLLNRKTVFYTYQHEVYYEIEHTDNCVFILVSLSGENPQMLELAEAAKEKQHLVVSLTHISENALQAIADYPLYCYSPKRLINGYNITDKTPLQLVLNSLFEIYLRNV